MNPQDPMPPAPRSYKALHRLELSGGREVQDGETFEESPEQMVGLVEGVDYECVEPGE